MHKNIKIKTEFYACKMHDKINQLYDNKYPYRHHLTMVVVFAEKFIHLIPKKDRDTVIAGCWAHDLIEDAGVSYNDVLKHTNEIVAEYSYALSNEKGRTRKERANDNYYKGIKDYKHATYIKLCDRIANVSYGKERGSNQFNMYKKEQPNFKEKLFDERYKEVWDYLDNLLKN